ncbi:MAG: tRNA 2-thiouridine(34) synthase MnmA [Microgenomates group bacterium]
MNAKKVALGLSGGVDSSVAAALLLEQDYDVTGVYLECYNEPGCRTDQDKKDALQVALKLGIKFEVLDFRREYREKVIEYFYTEYEAGRTPNPDVMCNKEIKFGIFYDWALRKAQGRPRFDYVATGHYARVAEISNNQLPNSKQMLLQRARDESKDQSYFLWQIPKDHLEHILFPLGEMLKSEVRAKAKELGLGTATKPDSMGICFIGDVDVHKLLKDKLGENPGEVIMSPARTVLAGVIGTHKGLWFYTIGQRGGWEMNKLDHLNIKPMNHLGINMNKLPPLYVIGKDKEKNILIVGTREATMRNEFKVKKIEGIAGPLWVRIRNLGELYEVIDFDGETVYIKEPVFAVAEGQSCVFYNESQVLVAGSIIV